MISVLLDTLPWIDKHKCDVLLGQDFMPLQLLEAGAGHGNKLSLGISLLALALQESRINLEVTLGDFFFPMMWKATLESITFSLPTRITLWTSCCPHHGPCDKLLANREAHPPSFFSIKKGLKTRSSDKSGMVNSKPLDQWSLTVS